MSLKDIYNQKIYPNLYFAGQRLERIPYHIYAGKHAEDTESFNRDLIKIMQNMNTSILTSVICIICWL